MRLLVTGGAGFLGARLCPLLAAAPGVAAVSVFDAAETPGGLRGDIADFAALVPDGAADVVIHAAAITALASEADPDRAWAINVEGTRAVLAWCRRQSRPVRLLLLSSVTVFGAEEALARESSPAAPCCTYGMTKLVAEQLVLDAARRGEVEGRILRLPISAIRTSRVGRPGAGFLSDLVDHVMRGRVFGVPLPMGRRMPVASVGAGLAMIARLALAPVLPARLLHLPSLGVSANDAVAALVAAGFPEAPALVRPAPEADVGRMVAGWPQRLGTDFPEMSADLADAGFGTLIEAHRKMVGATGIEPVTLRV